MPLTAPIHETTLRPSIPRWLVTRLPRRSPPPYFSVLVVGSRGMHFLENLHLRFAAKKVLTPWAPRTISADGNGAERERRSLPLVRVFE